MGDNTKMIKLLVAILFISSYACSTNKKIMTTEKESF
jgi:hypothetical protein